MELLHLIEDRVVASFREDSNELSGNYSTEELLAATPSLLFRRTPRGVTRNAMRGYVLMFVYQHSNKHIHQNCAANI